MRILQIIDSLEAGGAERMCLNMANTFSEHSIENSLIVTRPPHTLLPRLNKRTTVLTTVKKNRWDVQTFRQLCRFVRKIKPQYLHAHSTTLLWAVFLKLIFPSVKVIWHDHYGNRKVAGDRLIHQLLSPFITAIVTVNEDLAAFHRKHLFVADNKIRFLPNFPALDAIPLQERRKQTIVMSANLIPLKDHLTLLKALTIVNARQVPFELLLIGKNVYPEYTAMLQNYIHEHHLEHCVQFVGQVSNIEPLLGKASIGVLTSIYEGLPVSILEYGLAGLAVISTDVGQCARVLENGKFGWIVSPQDSERLAEVIEKLLLNPDMAAEKAVAFQQHIETNYTGSRFLSDYTLLLQS